MRKASARSPRSSAPRTPGHALELTNRSDYGLSAALVTNDLQHAVEFARKLEAGNGAHQ
jgi:acyl-CoA reductase-like NAD-dependent aldehyde dehydrogenase